MATGNIIDLTDNQAGASPSTAASTRGHASTVEPGALSFKAHLNRLQQPNGGETHSAHGAVPPKGRESTSLPATQKPPLPSKGASVKPSAMHLPSQHVTSLSTPHSLSMPSSETLSLLAANASPSSGHSAAKSGVKGRMDSTAGGVQSDTVLPIIAGLITAPITVAPNAVSASKASLTRGPAGTTTVDTGHREGIVVASSGSPTTPQSMLETKNGFPKSNQSVEGNGLSNRAPLLLQTSTAQTASMSSLVQSSSSEIVTLSKRPAPLVVPVPKASSGEIVVSTTGTSLLAEAAPGVTKK